MLSNDLMIFSIPKSKNSHELKMKGQMLNPRPDSNYF